MSKILAGFLIIAVLFGCGAFNSIKINSKMESLEDGVERVSLLAEIDSKKAQELLKQVIAQWHTEDKLSHIFIHHDRIDAVNDAFYSYLSSLENSQGDTEGEKEKLLYHIRTFAELEMLLPGSVF